MDHSMMDHSGMDHGDMDNGAMCSMNMLFTWDTTNLCVVFRSWRVTGTVSLIGTLIAIALLTAGYELVREMARRYDTVSQKEIDSLPNEQNLRHDHNTSTAIIPIPERRSLLSWRTAGRRDSSSAQANNRVVRAALYAVQVFYSFFIMLLFMTYNGWVMLAVGVGAFVGFLVFGSEGSVAKSAACH